MDTQIAQTIEPIFDHLNGLSALELLLKNASALDEIAEEQESLIAGDVLPADSHRRLAIAGRFSEACQLLLLRPEMNGLDNHIQALSGIREKAESILRENPVLQAKGPIYVVRNDDMPERYVINKSFKRELRKGFGLHRMTKNERGISVVTAFTHPDYEQLYHKHTVGEYTLLLDSNYIGSFINKEIKILQGSDGEMFHFGSDTHHTLRNVGDNTGRTITAKYPIGISVWTPTLDISNTFDQGFGRVVKPAIEKHRHHTIRRFHIEDGFHNYDIELTDLNPNGTISRKMPIDDYVFLVSGSAQIRGNRYENVAGKNDLLVIEHDTTCSLCAGSNGAKFYRVNVKS